VAFAFSSFPALFAELLFGELLPLALLLGEFAALLFGEFAAL
jgi:hypothetical protein